MIRHLSLCALPKARHTNTETKDSKRKKRTPLEGKKNVSVTLAPKVARKVAVSCETEKRNAKMHV